MTFALQFCSSAEKTAHFEYKTGARTPLFPTTRTQALASPETLRNGACVFGCVLVPFLLLILLNGLCWFVKGSPRLFLNRAELTIPPAFLQHNHKSGATRLGFAVLLKCFHQENQR